MDCKLRFDIRTYSGVVAFAVAVAAVATTARANVYPTSLKQSSNSLNKTASEMVSLSYLLNEDATGVSVDILNSSNTVVRTISPGAQTKGVQSILWDGKDNSAAFLPNGNYSFRVNTTGAERAAWTQISTDSDLNSFFVPRGVAVNKNPNSPYYGRVYVAESRGGQPTVAPVRATPTVDGVYMLNADLSVTGIAEGTGPHAGNIPWRTSASDPVEGTTTPPSPFRLEIGPDDSVYITDWSDQNPGIFQAPPNLSGTFVSVLDSTGAAGTGLNATHGSISDAIIVGTGANRVIYTADEDFVPVAGTTSTGSVLRYDIGNTTTFTGAPSGFAYQDGAGADTQVNRIQNFVNSLAFDEDGNLWMSQVRSTVPAANDTLTSLMQIDSTGAVLWSSVTELGGGTTANDPLRGTQAIAYDPVNNLLALGTNQTGGAVILFDPVSKSIINTFTFGNTTNTDLAFDAVGNLYVNNRSGERLRVWAPPTAPAMGFVANAFSTDSLGALGSILLTDVAVGLAGDFDEDNDVDAADYVKWRNQDTFGPLPNDNGAASAQAQYDLWKANFGNISPGASAGVGVNVPEPGTLLLALSSLATVGMVRRRRG